MTQDEWHHGYKCDNKGTGIHSHFIDNIGENQLCTYTANELLVPALD